MQKSFSSDVELDQLQKIKRAIHPGRDALGRILPGSTMIPNRYRPDTPCEGPGCTNIVPAGLVMAQQKRAFCSPICRVGFHSHQHYCGNCEYCGDPFYRAIDAVGVQKHCSREHRVLAEADLKQAPMGPFRSLVETYLATTTRYRGRTLNGVKVALVRFFGYAHEIEGATELKAIKSSIVTRFVAAERLRGITTTNSVSFVAMFFKHMMAEDDAFTLRNPVIPHIHYQKRNLQAPRPYKDEDLKFIWNIVEERNRLSLLLAMAIGEECGLRVGEVCNIRLSDIDSVKQTVFVRLPTKNMGVRTVPFHDKVAALLPLWLSQRAPDCTHDHLLHSVKLAAFTSSSLDLKFRKLFKNHPAPANGFSFHRLRHTWATRLMNGGMELAVLMHLGGWKDWTSMRRYIKVLPSTIKAQYEEAYRKLTTKVARPDEPTLSLVAFSMLPDSQPQAAPQGVA
jgi:integrase